MANWKKVLVSGSAIEVRNITASNLPESTAGSDKIVVIDTTTGQFAYTSSAAGGGGIFVSQDGGTYYNTENTLHVSASTPQSAPTATNTVATQSAARYAFMVSESAHFYNHNAGYPTSNAWKTNLQGSYFNNFDSNTDVSEILRFVAGILSSSAPSPAPNSRLIDQFTSTENNKTTATLGSSDFPEGNIPVGYTDPHIQYIIDKGFTSTGRELFELITGVTKIKSNDYYITYATDTNDSTDNSSNAGDTQLVGFGGTGAPAVAIRLVQSIFFDNDGTSWNLIDSTTTSSIHFFRNANPDTTAEGIELYTIPTAQPTVIPAAFVDGRATGLAPNSNAPILFGFDGLNPEGVSSASISSSGFYNVRDNWNVYTGSQESNAALSRTNDNEKTIFYIPVGQTGGEGGDVFSTLTSQLSNNVTFLNSRITSGSFTSRSLSGAPYLNSGQWTYIATASNAFKPLYSDDATLTGEGINTSNITNISSDNGTDITAVDFVTSGWTATTANIAGQITNAGTVFNGATDQNGSVPNIESAIRLEKTETFGSSKNGTDTNMTVTTSDSVDDTFTNSFTVQAINTSGAEDEYTESYTHRPHLAGHFGQPASSGSMVLFKSSDGQDTSTTTNEKFLGEKYRRTIGDPESDLTTAFDSGSRLALGSIGDLQVKPGYLVNPESSTYGYWYPTDATSYYKWYLREFDTAASANVVTLTINTHPDSNTSLTTFDDTTDDKIAVGIIFERQLPSNSGEARVTVWDAGKLNAGYSNTNISAATAQYNPFSSAIDIKGNFLAGSTLTSGTYTLKLDNGIYQTINGTYQKMWLLVRYKGDPTNPLEDIDISI